MSRVECCLRMGSEELINYALAHPTVCDFVVKCFAESLSRERLDIQVVVLKHFGKTKDAIMQLYWFPCALLAVLFDCPNVLDRILKSAQNCYKYTVVKFDLLRDVCKLLNRQVCDGILENNGIVKQELNTSYDEIWGLIRLLNNCHGAVISELANALKPYVAQESIG